MNKGEIKSLIYCVRKLNLNRNDKVMLREYLKKDVIKAERLYILSHRDYRGFARQIDKLIISMGGYGIRNYNIRLIKSCW